MGIAGLVLDFVSGLRGEKKNSFKALFLFGTHLTQSGQIQLYFMLKRKLLPHLLGYPSVQEPAAPRSPLA